MLRRLPTPNLPPRLFLQKLLFALRPEMMQAPPIPRDRLPITGRANDVPMLADLYGSLLQSRHAVTVPHCAEESRADKDFDFEVVVAEIVDDASIESFAGSFGWPGKKAGGAVDEPINADGADGIVARPAVEEARERFAACHLQKLVGVEESHPRVLVAIELDACSVVFFLDASPFA